MLKSELAKVTLDDYDRLIQICDSMATAEGVAKMEERMLDVKRRYGSYPQDKWDANIGLRAYFEEKAGGKNIYELVVKDTFRP